MPCPLPDYSFICYLPPLSGSESASKEASGRGAWRTSRWDAGLLVFGWPIKLYTSLMFCLNFWTLMWYVSFVLSSWTQRGHGEKMDSTASTQHQVSAHVSHGQEEVYFTLTRCQFGAQWFWQSLFFLWIRNGICRRRTATRLGHGASKQTCSHSRRWEQEIVSVKEKKNNNFCALNGQNTSEVWKENDVKIFF